jgi:hypothetical protein
MMIKNQIFKFRETARRQMCGGQKKQGFVARPGKKERDFKIPRGRKKKGTSIGWRRGFSQSIMLTPFWAPPASAARALR